MPAGCDFICNNSECVHVNKGFAITAPWPMGEIEPVLRSFDTSKMDESKEMMIDYKNQGRKYACITLPNISKVPVVAYRISLWSPKACCVWQFDVEKGDSKTIDEAITNAHLPTQCQKTGGPLLSFKDVLTEGINCPHCFKKMDQSRWFTNE